MDPLDPAPPPGLTGILHVEVMQEIATHATAAHHLECHDPLNLDKFSRSIEKRIDDVVRREVRLQVTAAVNQKVRRYRARGARHRRSL